MVSTLAQSFGGTKIKFFSKSANFFIFTFRYRKPPLADLIKSLQRHERITVKFVDEFCTSRVCCLCRNYLEVAEPPMRFVYCRRCDFTSNRDANAAQNIAQNAFPPLPEIFTRPPRIPADQPAAQVPRALPVARRPRRPAPQPQDPPAARQPAAPGE